jgi:hypothetical protein
MRKKHGSVPKLHTCSGPESRNEQKTPAFGVPFQTELRFRLRGYGQPPRRGSPWSDKLWVNHQQNAGRPQAHRQILAAVLAVNVRGRAECCILARRQQFAFPGMAGGRLRRRARGDCHHQKLEEEAVRRPVQEVEPRLASLPAPARMTNTLNTEGGIGITARFASPHPGAGGHRLG